ncbi:S8 family serine peptidase [Pseudoalteromonas umbrosa]|uniref:S8 family serine peptidase n=1 Tax=Pseudoalteromonas umbrosa TaxID=3048489 RepID=UPI0024C42EAB|nr:S8 family serine peptidase [Pseudoalteromonas sp. B95]MDK1286889.1 S8 family serine peptidase [Pseudoalteromonas sp. B95]
MNKWKLTPIAMGLLAGSAVSVQAAEFYSNSPGTQAIEDSYIVVYKVPQGVASADNEIKAQFTTQLTNTLTTEIGIEVTRQYSSSISGVAVNADAKQLLKLLSHPDVDFVEQNAIVTVAPIKSKSSYSALQNNPVWGLDRIDQRDLPLDQKFEAPNKGTGVTAYVIDTGIQNSHNEFGGRSVNGYDFVDNDGNSADCNGHGTHVAGTIGGATYGVAKNVKLVGVRVLNCSGSGTYAGVIAGIDWVANNANGPSVANMSLGGGKSQAVNNAVTSAVNKGISFVVAAGNENSDACTRSPASTPAAVTVASSTSSDARSGFSNWGKCIDVFGPGSSIKSAWIGSDSATRTISGTSMAAPHVAGVAALFLEKNPTSSPTQVTAALSGGASENKISDVKGSPNKLVYVEAGGDDGGFEKVISGGKNETKAFTYEVPAGATSLKVTLSGGSGDADLYIKHGAEPWAFDSDCASENPDTSNESCVINNPKAGTWYISAYGYAAFNNVTLKANHQ